MTESSIRHDGRNAGAELRLQRKSAGSAAPHLAYKEQPPQTGHIAAAWRPEALDERPTHLQTCAPLSTATLFRV